MIKDIPLIIRNMRDHEPQKITFCTDWGILCKYIRFIFLLQILWRILNPSIYFINHGRKTLIQGSAWIRLFFLWH